MKSSFLHFDMEELAYFKIKIVRSNDKNNTLVINIWPSNHQIKSYQVLTNYMHSGGLVWATCDY